MSHFSVIFQYWMQHKCYLKFYDKWIHQLFTEICYFISLLILSEIHRCIEPASIITVYKSQLFHSKNAPCKINKRKEQKCCLRLGDYWHIAHKKVECKKVKYTRSMRSYNINKVLTTERKGNVENIMVVWVALSNKIPTNNDLELVPLDRELPRDRDDTIIYKCNLHNSTSYLSVGASYFGWSVLLLWFKSNSAHFYQIPCKSMIMCWLYRVFTKPGVKLTKPLSPRHIFL